jgi:hypothetical protein
MGSRGGSSADSSAAPDMPAPPPADVGVMAAALVEATRGCGEASMASTVHCERTRQRGLSAHALLETREWED